MPTCSFCDASLESVDVESGLCPVCGKSLTIRDTVEFDDPTEGAAAPTDSEENLATVETDDVATSDDGSPVGSDTVDLSSDEFEQVSAETGDVAK